MIQTIKNIFKNYSYQQFFLLILAISIFAISYFIIAPLLSPILSAIILAYLFYPAYAALLKKFSKIPALAHRAATFASGLVILIIMLVFLAPLLTLVFLLFLNLKDIQSFFLFFIPKVSTYISTLVENLNNGFFPNQSISVFWKHLFSVSSTAISTLLQKVITEFPQFLLHSFISLFIVFYLLKNARVLLEIINKFLPLSDQQKKMIVRRFSGLGRGMISSQFAIALLQSILMAIACLILGLPHLLLLTLLTFVLAIIPMLGAILVWVSLTIYLLVGVQDGIPLWKPIFMFLYGTFLVSLVDNFVRTKILSQEIKINPAIVLIGFIGGFLLFGIPGIFLGPLFLTLSELALEITIALLS